MGRKVVRKSQFCRGKRQALPPSKSIVSSLHKVFGRSHPPNRASSACPQKNWRHYPPASLQNLDYNPSTVLILAFHGWLCRGRVSVGNKPLALDSELGSLAHIEREGG